MMRLTGIQEVTGYILMQTCRSPVKMERLSNWLKTAVQIIMPRNLFEGSGSGVDAFHIHEYGLNMIIFDPNLKCLNLIR